MSTLLKMQKFHPLCSRCIGMYPLQNRWTVLRYLQCYENFSECCTHLILPETALFSPTPTFAKEPKYFDVDVEDMAYYEVARFIESDENLMEKLHEAYKTYLDEMENDYVERADHIISEWESNEEEDYCE